MMQSSTLTELLDRLTAARDFYTPSSRAVRLRERPLRTLALALRSRLAKIWPSAAIISARTFWGDWMSVLLPDGASIVLWGFFDGEELNLTRYLTKHLQSGQTFFDVGAQAGFYSMLAARLVGPEGSVHAFEPTPRTLAVLKDNVAPFPAVAIHPCALWRENGEIDFTDFGPLASAFNTVLDPQAYLPQTELSAPPRRIRVPARTLDSMIEEIGKAPDFLKIDAEGVELEVLKGAERTLAARPIISAEVWGMSESARGKSRELISFLEKKKYTPFRLKQGVRESFDPNQEFAFANIIFIPN